MRPPPNYVCRVRWDGAVNWQATADHPIFCAMKRKCPTCARLFAESDEVRAFRPFCSVRCRSADLGKWLDGGYKIETAASE